MPFGGTCVAHAHGFHPQCVTRVNVSLTNNHGALRMYMCVLGNGTLSSPMSFGVHVCSLSSLWRMQICKEVPWIVKNYQLDEVTTVQRLRSQIAEHFRNVPTDDYRVVDVRMFKARAEATVRASPHFSYPFTSYIQTRMNSQ